MLAVVIFVKRLANAKSRLSTILSPHDRLAFASRMLLQVADAARGAIGVGEVIVVSPDTEITAIFGGRDVRFLHERKSRGLNAAALFATAKLAAAGTPRALLLPADLPRIRSEHIEALIETHSRTGRDTIVPATDGSGTNALIVELPPRFALAFGPDSFNRHLANAARSKRLLAVHRCLHIGFDIDRPEDFRHPSCGMMMC